VIPLSFSCRNPALGSFLMTCPSRRASASEAYDFRPPGLRKASPWDKGSPLARFLNNVRYSKLMIALEGLRHPTTVRPPPPLRHEGRGPTPPAPELGASGTPGRRPDRDSEAGIERAPSTGRLGLASTHFPPLHDRANVSGRTLLPPRSRTSDNLRRSHMGTPIVSVYLDSSCFHRERARGEGALQRLHELVQHGVVKVYVHELVVREVATGFVESLNKTDKPLKELRQALSWLSNQEREEAFQATQKIKSLKAKANAHLAEELKLRLQDFGAEIIDVTLGATQEMWRRYFSGDTPFIVQKSRKDLPDGAILVGALDLSARLVGRRLHIVAGDHRLRAACAPTMVCHEKLGEFTGCDEVTEALRSRARERGEDVPEEEIDTWGIKVGECIRNDHTTIVKLVNSALLQALTGTEVSSDLFPSDDNDATIDMVGDVEELTIALDDLDYISKTEMMASFTAQLNESQVTLYVDRAEIDVIGEDGLLSMSISDPDWNEHVAQVEARVLLSVTGRLRLELEEDEYETLRLVTAAVDDVETVDVVSSA